MAFPIPVPSIKDITDIADQLGVIKAVKSKLVSQPDPALDKLTTVLDEISKIYGVMNNEITSYLSLIFDPSDTKTFQEGRTILLSVEGGSVQVEMSKTRGKCGKITSIYRTYLDPWFKRILANDEEQKIQNLFKDLQEFDSAMNHVITDLAEWLTGNAFKTLNLVDEGKLQEANDLIKANRKEIQPIRIELSQRMQDLYNLQAEFIGESGAL